MSLHKRQNRNGAVTGLPSGLVMIDATWVAFENAFWTFCSCSISNRSVSVTFVDLNSLRASPNGWLPSFLDKTSSPHHRNRPANDGMLIFVGVHVRPTPAADRDLVFVCSSQFSQLCSLKEFHTSRSASRLASTAGFRQIIQPASRIFQVLDPPPSSRPALAVNSSQGIRLSTVAKPVKHLSPSTSAPGFQAALPPESAQRHHRNTRKHVFCLQKIMTDSRRHAGRFPPI